MPQNLDVTRGRARGRPGRVLAAGLAALFAATAARAGERFELFPSPAERRYLRDDAPKPELSLALDGLTTDVARDRDAPADASAKPPFWEIHNPAVAAEAFPLIPPEGVPARPLLDRNTSLLTGGVLLLTTIYANSGAWTYGYQDFHFHSEHWFGPNTYGGGADKASHFIITASMAREIALLSDAWGHTREQSVALGLGVTALSGLLVEIGDGVSPYGFSWEDLTSDVLGAATGVFLTRHGLNDVFGLRVGKVPTSVPASEENAYLGSGYSTEIYSADFRVAGLARRWRFEPAVARFLMASVTYQTKGYGYVPPVADRQRLVGFEIGLNVPEILAAAGVPETKWWGSALYKIFSFFRVPYTSFGWRYDLNHHRWHGPDTGDKYYGAGG